MIDNKLSYWATGFVSIFPLLSNILLQLVNNHYGFYVLFKPPDIVACCLNLMIFSFISTINMRDNINIKENKDEDDIILIKQLNKDLLVDSFLLITDGFFLALSLQENSQENFILTIIICITLVASIIIFINLNSNSNIK